jgi:hypothetical protein
MMQSERCGLLRHVDLNIWSVRDIVRTRRQQSRLICILNHKLLQVMYNQHFTLARRARAWLRGQGIGKASSDDCVPRTLPPKSGKISCAPAAARPCCSCVAEAVHGPPVYAGWSHDDVLLVHDDPFLLHVGQEQKIHNIMYKNPLASWKHIM